ncbi:MAG: cysteine synthase family protein [Holophaga sp.]|nr:cysteine synthase family protein [Holophaga sp.]
MQGTHCAILETIGKTPLVELPSLSRESGCQVFAKLEFLNPMGSIKDRVARYMIEAAERDGRIQPGDMILENSSGNTALGLALVAIQKGYRLKVVVRDRISREKLDQLRVLGVEVHLTDSSLPPEHPESYNRITPRLARETPHCYFPDQHSNRENNAAHYHGTGPEIWEQMEGRIDAFVAGAGTGGTISGVGRFLKEQDPKIQVIAIDPIGSVFHDHFRGRKNLVSGPYLVEGLGDEFPIATMDFEILDDILQVKDQDTFLEARALARSEGLLVGGSSGAAIWGVRQIAAKLGPNARIVTVFPDGASRYLSTVFSDDWMRAQGFLVSEA